MKKNEIIPLKNEENQSHYGQNIEKNKYRKMKLVLITKNIINSGIIVTLLVNIMELFIIFVI